MLLLVVLLFVALWSGVAITLAGLLCWLGRVPCVLVVAADSLLSLSNVLGE